LFLLVVRYFFGAGCFALGGVNAAKSKPKYSRLSRALTAMWKTLLRQLKLSRFQAGRSSDRADPAMAMAAEMLIAPSAMIQLSVEEAQVVVRYMQPLQVPSGTVFIREGDSADTGYLVLVLEGDVVVDGVAVSRMSPITVTVLGPGSMLGDLGLMNGLPRSASCTAGSDLRCAMLTRNGRRPAGVVVA
jgi:CRP-like cAMP-binding protein